MRSKLVHGDMHYKKKKNLEREKKGKKRKRGCYSDSL